MQTHDKLFIGEPKAGKTTRTQDVKLQKHETDATKAKRNSGNKSGITRHSKQHNTKQHNWGNKTDKANTKMKLREH